MCDTVSTVYRKLVPGLQGIGIYGYFLWVINEILNKTAIIVVTVSIKLTIQPAMPDLPVFVSEVVNI